MDAREAGTTELVTADVAAELAAVRLIVEAATEAAKRWEAMYRSYASTGESRLLADALDTLSERVREADHA